MAESRPSTNGNHRARSSDEGVSYLLWRLFEITVSLVVLVLTLPVMAILALLIRLTSPGPAIFVQQRVGKGCRNFPFRKFRTMYADARKRFPELYAYAYDDQAIKTLKFKVDPDPRLTPIGRILRKTSLDELPNFWNVLVGDMSLVGPRPEIPEMLPYYHGEMREKFSVRPGVTGLAQVSGRGNLGFLETVDLDLKYVRNRSVSGDILLLLQTVKKVLTGDGAF